MKILIFGEETYLLDKAVETEISGIDAPEMNVTRFDDGYSIDDVERLCFTAPFFSNRRAVILRLRELKADDGLKKLIGTIPETTVFVVAADRVDKRSALYKVFQKATKGCSKPELRKVYDLVRRVAESEGRIVEQAAVEEMVKRLNYYDDAQVNLYSVIGCVRQLAQSGDITMSLVSAMLPESAAGKSWKLLSLVCEGDMREAFSLLGYLLDSGENAIGVLSLLLRGFRLAWKDVTGIPEENLRYQYAAALKYSAKALVSAQEILESAVMQLKSGAEAGVMSRLALAKISGVLI